MMLRVLCFGEVLWDLLPQGRYLGGAPLNVAYHLAQLGCAPTLVSAVGCDELGREALAAITTAGIDATTVAQQAALATGTAQVRLDAGGHASFTLPQPVAWDSIPIDAALTGPAPVAIVFGTLALRGSANRSALTRLLSAFPEATVVCDLNLRPPFDDLAPLAPLLGCVDLIKLNADEACRLSGRSTGTAHWRDISTVLSAHHPGAVVCITLGEGGACIQDGTTWLQVAAPSVAVRDTIGAGDAFTAALLTGWIQTVGTQPDWPHILRGACALGAFVASQDGAQPSYGDFRVNG